jgi:hypothetical protein
LYLCAANVEKFDCLQPQEKMLKRHDAVRIKRPKRIAPPGRQTFPKTAQYYAINFNKQMQQ